LVALSDGQKMEEDGNRWLLATLGAALCWSVADILCDMCIGEEDEDEEGFELVPLGDSVKKGSSEDLRAANGVVDGIGIDASVNKVVSKRRTNSDTTTVRRSVVNETGTQQEPTLIRSESREGPTSPQNSSLEGSSSKMSRSSEHDQEIGHDEDEDGFSHLDGSQDCAVAGMTTGSVMYMLSIKRVHVHKTAAYAAKMDSSLEAVMPQFQFIWSPTADIEWWLAAVGGTLMFAHYFLLLRAFDNAPSTVINPLIQVSSTWMLLGSAVPAAITGTTFIRPFDLLCYFVIVVGGILPSLDGDLKRMMHWKFWKQGYVKNTVLSEVTVGIYDLVMSYCIRNSAKKDKFRDIAPSDLEFEFFFVAWCGFVVSFCVIFALIPTLRQKFIDLARVPRKIVILSAAGQALTLFGYYLSQFAYSWYYQASIVHAAESSLSQGINLVFAVVGLKLLGIGRESAVSNLKIKIISCVVVSIGLFMLTLTESEDPAFVPPEISDPLDSRALPMEDSSQDVEVASLASSVAFHPAGLSVVNHARKSMRRRRRRPKQP